MAVRAAAVLIPAVLLLHGFGESRTVFDGLKKHLLTRGWAVMALDLRGHGASEKLYDSALYPAAEMAEDARRLLDHLGIPQADVMGYSMGARIAAFLAVNHPERVTSLVFGGMGTSMVRGMAGLTSAITSRALLIAAGMMSTDTPRLT